MRAWWSAFGSGAPHVFTVRRAGKVVAVLPMQRRRRALHSPTNAHTPLFDMLAIDEAAGRAAAGALFASDADAITIGPIDAHGPALHALRSAADAAGYRYIVEPVLRAPYISGGMTLGEYRGSLSHNLRHDVERRLRRLCEAGAVRVEISDGAENVEQLLDEGLRVEASGWKGARGTAIRSEPSTRHFYGEVARWAASSGWLRLAFLRLNDRALAFQFDLERDRTYYSLKIGYDPEYERFSPGKLLAYMMVLRAVARGLETYELLGTDEPWKHRWTASFRERVVLRSFARSPAGVVRWVTDTQVRRVVRRVPLATRVAAALRD
jgi:CelD/BcsL family acetyltransferase involved in cellulose biosynthesis